MIVNRAQFSDYFIPVHSIHDHNTRQASKGDIFISSVNTTQYGKRTAKFVGSVRWNNLPPPLRECPSSRNFKNAPRAIFLFVPKLIKVCL